MHRCHIPVPAVLPLQPIPLNRPRKQTLHDLRSELREPLRSEPDVVGHTQRQQEHHPGPALRGHAVEEDLHDAEPQHQQLPLQRSARSAQPVRTGRKSPRCQRIPACSIRSSTASTCVRRSCSTVARRSDLWTDRRHDSDGQRPSIRAAATQMRSSTTFPEPTCQRRLQHDCRRLKPELHHDGHNAAPAILRDTSERHLAAERVPGKLRRDEPAVPDDEPTTTTAATTTTTRYRFRCRCVQSGLQRTGHVQLEQEPGIAGDLTDPDEPGCRTTPTSATTPVIRCGRTARSNCRSVRTSCSWATAPDGWPARSNAGSWV